MEIAKTNEEATHGSLFGEALPAVAELERRPASACKTAIEADQPTTTADEIHRCGTAIEADHPARAIWEMLGQVDLSPFEETIRAVEGRAGQATVSPRLFPALWIYGYSEAISSARELSRMCAYEPGCQWLTGMEGVNHHTLSDFRVEHKEGAGWTVRSGSGSAERRRAVRTETGYPGRHKGKSQCGQGYVSARRPGKAAFGAGAAANRGHGGTAVGSRDAARGASTGARVEREKATAGIGAGRIEEGSREQNRKRKKPKLE